MPTASKHRQRLTQPTPLADVRGASRLVIDLTLLVTGLVETLHHNIARRPGILGRATLAPTKGITGLVYRSVRGITRLVGGRSTWRWRCWCRCWRTRATGPAATSWSRRSTACSAIAS
ncbi:MAG: hypothetical protein IPJ62_05860 [Betaproteobacteria bacterium]|nr:hypothetical protein [Betaproteobacteria bacterium]